MSDEVSANSNASEVTLEWLRKQGTDFELAEGVTKRSTPERRPVIGDYVILEKIGSGGMGQVFRARHRTMQRDVAIKLLPRDFRSTRVGRAILRRSTSRWSFDASQHCDRIRCRMYLPGSLSGDGMIDGNSLSHKIASHGLFSVARSGQHPGSSRLSLALCALDGGDSPRHQAWEHDVEQQRGAQDTRLRLGPLPA